MEGNIIIVVLWHIIKMSISLRNLLNHLYLNTEKLVCLVAPLVNIMQHLQLTIKINSVVILMSGAILYFNMLVF